MSGAKVAAVAAVVCVLGTAHGAGAAGGVVVAAGETTHTIDYPEDPESSSASDGVAAVAIDLATGSGTIAGNDDYSVIGFSDTYLAGECTGADPGAVHCYYEYPCCTVPIPFCPTGTSTLDLDADGTLVYVFEECYGEFTDTVSGSLTRF